MQITLYALNKALVLVFICFHKIVYHHSAVNVSPILNKAYFTRLILDCDFAWRIKLYKLNLDPEKPSNSIFTLYFILMAQNRQKRLKKRNENAVINLA